MAVNAEVEPVRQRQSISNLEVIPEVHEPAQEIVVAPNVEQVDLGVQQDAVIVDQSTIEPEVLRQQDVNANVQLEVDISDMPTQVLETLSQETRKRQSDDAIPSKKFKCSRLSARDNSQRDFIIPEIVLQEPDKENVPPNIQTPVRASVGEQLQPQLQLQMQPQLLLQPQLQPLDTGHVSTMLQKAGISDIQQIQERELIEAQTTQPRARREDSDGSETPLGSLDRTKVSLGESTQTTDSLRLIRNHWGIEGTMMKILQLARYSPDITFTMLLGSPIVAGQKRIIAAKCFTSILKLKQYGFVRVTTDPETRQIISVRLGPRFE